MASIPQEERALILQGGGSLGAYEAGAYKATYSFLKHLLKSGYDDVVDYIKTRFGTKHLDAAGIQYKKTDISAG